MGSLTITESGSVLSNEIFSNINTKIKMVKERMIIIQNPMHGFSQQRFFPNLNNVEAIVSYIFSKFAIPTNITFFEEIDNQKDRRIGENFYI